MNFAAQIQAYGKPLAELVDVERLPELGPGSEVRSMGETLRAMQPSDLFGEQAIKNRSAAACCLSGLWLYYDYLDESHELSQSISDGSGSFWHGIMHRREPDYSNSKYWFHRVGNHPAFDAIFESVVELEDSTSNPVSAELAAEGAWRPNRFVDLCSKYYRSNSDEELRCREIAKAEWLALFDFCYQVATK